MLRDTPKRRSPTQRRPPVPPVQQKFEIPRLLGTAASNIHTSASLSSCRAPPARSYRHEEKQHLHESKIGTFFSGPSISGVSRAVTAGPWRTASPAPRAGRPPSNTIDQPGTVIYVRRQFQRAISLTGKRFTSVITVAALSRLAITPIVMPLFSVCWQNHDMLGSVAPAAIGRREMPKIIICKSRRHARVIWGQHWSGNVTARQPMRTATFVELRKFVCSTTDQILGW